MAKGKVFYIGMGFVSILAFCAYRFFQSSEVDNQELQINAEEMNENEIEVQESSGSFVLVDPEAQDNQDFVFVDKDVDNNNPAREQRVEEALAVDLEAVTVYPPPPLYENYHPGQMLVVSQY